MTTTDKTPEWDGAPVVTDSDGDHWCRRPNGEYGSPFGLVDRTAAELERDFGPCKAADLHPATTPEPRTVTWRKGEDKTEIREAWQPGRRAQVVTEAGGVITTRDGVITSAGFARIALGEWLSFDSTVSITVWLPETPEVPKWAQDYTLDLRAVVTDDRRVWKPFIARHRKVQEWRATDGSAAKTTEELVAMGGKLLIDPDGKAVL